MKTAMLIEDRDLGYLFLDADKAHEDATPVEFTLAPGVLFSDIEDDEKVIWMLDAKDGKHVNVVFRDTVDFDSDDFTVWYPIPACVVCLTLEDYETAQLQ